MRIAIDCRVASEKPKGIGKYLIDAINALSRNIPDWTFILLSPHKLEGTYINLTNDNIIYKFCPLPKVINKYQLWYNTKFVKVAANLKADLIWTPFPAKPLFVPKSLKTLITVHDVVSIEFAHTQSIGNRIANNLVFERGINTADLIWCNSKYTLGKVNDYFPQRKQKNIVVGDSCSEFINRLNMSKDRREALLAKYNINGKFLLFVGTLEPRKNLVFLLEVMKAYNEIDNSLKLLVVGGRGWKNNSIAKIINSQGYPKENVVFADYVSDTELVELYNIADCYISTALNEGFGMPQLEAMKCGCPVISPHNSAMIEVVHGRGITVEGWEVSDWCCAISKAIGYDRNNLNYDLKDYDWNEIAERVKSYIIDNL